MRRVYLPDDPKARPLTFAGEGPDTFVGDSLANVRKGLAQIPDGKRGALAMGLDWKGGWVPVPTIGVAARLGKGWELRGDGFLGAAEKGGRILIVKSW